MKMSALVDDRVVSVQVLEHLRLAVRFRDGLSGEVVFRESHLRGVFEALKDPAFFARVSCKEGFVEWPGEIDLAPDAMHEEIRAHGQWVLD
ncbi:MAG TPA: DUF2442 domain-containing protein [Thermoanaerobaculia bacterium]|nr:DUF2442 domain-containing protein [Thermoanaerobaculia bacterium]